MILRTVFWAGSQEEDLHCEETECVPEDTEGGNNSSWGKHIIGLGKLHIFNELQVPFITPSLAFLCTTCHNNLPV